MIQSPRQSQGGFVPARKNTEAATPGTPDTFPTSRRALTFRGASS